MVAWVTTDPQEQDELESGLTSGFWGRFTAHVQQEWGPAGERYQQALKQALSGPSGSEADAVHRLKMIAFAQAELSRVLQWPSERVAQLKSVTAKAAAGPVSRRGPGL